MIDRERLENLILARLSVPTKSPTRPSDVVKTVSVFLQQQLTEAERRKEITDAVERLRAAGFVSAGGLTLSMAGRERLSAAMDVVSIPSARDWADFKRRHLTRLLDKQPGPRVAANPGLVLVARKLGLPDEAARSQAALANAWLARSLGVQARNPTLSGIRTAFVASSLGVPVRPKLEDVLRISARAISGARTAGAGDIVQAMTAGWLSGAAKATSPGAPALPVPEAADAGYFERAVAKILDAAGSKQARRFGPSKVFIASVWENIREDPDIAGLGESGFKTLLIEAHRRGALTLSRADLVAAMDPADVEASETRHLNATYHFIEISGEPT